MKKTIISILSIITIIGTFLQTPSTVQAASNQISGTQVITDVYDSGEYIIETTLEICSETTTGGIATLSSATAKSKTATKTISYKTSSGSVLWSFKVTGTFTYNGSTSTCTSASYSKTVNSSAWSISSASVSRSGNTAIGKVTAKEKFLGITINTVNETVTLKCSASGSIS